MLQSGSTGGLGPGDADGVQSGIESELNREQLRSAQKALSVSNSRSRPSWSANTSSQTLATTSLDGSTRLTPARPANTAHLERRLRPATRRVAEANPRRSSALRRVAPLRRPDARALRRLGLTAASNRLDDKNRDARLRRKKAVWSAALATPALLAQHACRHRQWSVMHARKPTAVARLRVCAGSLITPDRIAGRVAPAAL